MKLVTAVTENVIQTESQSKNKQTHSVSRYTLHEEVVPTLLRDVLWRYLVKVFGTCLTTFDSLLPLYDL